MKVEHFFGLRHKGQPAILKADPAAAPVLLRLHVDKDNELRLCAESELLCIAIGPRAKEAVPA